MAARYMHGEIAVAQVKPGFAAETRQGTHEGWRISGAAPAGFKIGEARQGVTQGINVWANSEAEMLEIVPHIGSNGKFRGWEVVV